MKQQILIIQGGRVFESYKKYFEYLKKYQIDDLEKMKMKGWKDNLGQALGNDFEVIFPKMPCNRNAKYLEWEIWLEKFFPFLKNNIVLVGHSMGGIFLAKYLAKNNFSVKIFALHIVAAPFNSVTVSFNNEYLGDFILPKNLSKIEKQVKNIFLYHSKDDLVVPFSNLEKYAKFLPNAKKIIFENRNHFIQEKFLELTKNIKNKL